MVRANPEVHEAGGSRPEVIAEAGNGEGQTWVRPSFRFYFGRVISNTMNFSVGVAATISCGTFSGMSRKSPGPTR